MSLLKKIKNFIWSKTFLINLIVLGILYFVLIKGTMWYLDSTTRHGEHVDVPNLLGKNVNAIEANLSKLGLEYEVLDSIYEPKKIAGTILSQDPLPTDSTTVPIKEGRTIRLRVSKRTRLVEVPRCIDKSQRFAESILRNTGLKYTVEYKPTRESSGAVISQLYRGKPIQEKTKVPIGSTIKLIVGKNLGDEVIQLPNVVGLTISEAKNRLEGMEGLYVFTVCQDCITAADSTTSIVSSQTPEYVEGVTVPSGTTVTIFAKK